MTLDRNARYGTSVTASEGVSVITSGGDDVSLVVQYRARAGWKMRVVRIELYYDGDDDAWAIDCGIWTNAPGTRAREEMRRTAGEVEIELAASQDPSQPLPGT
jgi:hypothetical protein